MKIKILRLVLIGLIASFLQILFSSLLSIGSIFPNFFIAFATLFAISYDEPWGVAIIYLFGLLFDVLNPTSFGLMALTFVMIFIIIKRFSRVLNKSHYITNLIWVLISNLIYFILTIFYYFTFKEQLDIFSSHFLTFALYNIFSSTLCFVFLRFLYLLRFTLDD